ncbi:DUF883 family protein [Janthinobacterium agaricidamnosum]|uniref:DUF883 domain-containing protein n=1 Tax=Janthinobacterium agaricidamnosum NBRC 102515 = DSM 9628 TaxID=1349767 RepID=W0VA22_9BURK|nr:DUF883 family protein [Janthinobacterium agaricidamnosum]CDG84741.1 hypothetical protein GJA_4131 [Janthinobacterium agaricidamnosum NBRC 102515 = DSM 9628]
MDNSAQNIETQHRLIGDLRMVIENAEALLRNTDKYSSAIHQNARARLEQALLSATEELARFEDAQLDRMIATTAAASERCDDRSGEARVLRAFER